MRTQKIRNRLLSTTMIGGLAALAFAAPAMAQDAPASQDAELDDVVVTGSRITVPGLVSASPITSVGSEEIALQQTAEVEQIIRNLPIAQPGDGDAVNNGTAGVSTINLRGMGAQRNLVLINGQRVAPYNINGVVDVSGIPTAFLERIDIVTGGASAVYGSDAVTGAINFILKRDFEGFEAEVGYSLTGDNDGQTYRANVAMGANTEDGRGNVALNLNYNKREGVQFGARPLGQLGIVTATGANLAAFQSGAPPAPPADALCRGTGAVAAGGSTTTVPTRIAITGIGTSAQQFRNDGTLGATCSVFNFNPFNYYQTPLERFGGLAIGSYEINDHAEVYGRMSFTSTSVRQQIAPSGIFGESFFVPLSNPFLGAAARTNLLALANAGRLNGTLLPANWRDLNTNGVVDAADDLSLVFRRRTLELGERSTTYNNDYYSMVFGVRGEAWSGWNYDITVQRGEANRTLESAGYTNKATFQHAINAVSTTECRTGGAACVPVNVFGGLGTITPAMAAYISATGIETQNYVQQMATATIGGVVEGFRSPYASSSAAFNFGVEYREESAITVPDECLKLAPTSCLGGAGGNVTPVSGGFSVAEVFGEALIPLVEDMSFAKSLVLELGYRVADYDPSGDSSTYKVGLSWEPTEDLRFRVMQQRAARAPNIQELVGPRVTSLGNANFDPCSLGNPGAISAVLRARCISTGMTNAQVGAVQDIVSGQVGTFIGTVPTELPKIETADTLTAGVVWTPSFLPENILRPTFSFDYYHIDIRDPVGIYSAQEVLDACYDRGSVSSCAKIRRLNGDIATPGAGIETFTTNLVYQTAEGLEFGATGGLDLGVMFGQPSELNVGLNLNYYLTNESQSDVILDVIDCLGYYGTDCTNPTPELRFTQRATWGLGPLQLSYLWRYLGESAVEPDQVAATFAAFRTVDAYNYFDLSATYDLTDAARLSVGVTNVFDEQAPALGNEAGNTASNSGNTFPSYFDTLGRVYSVSMNVRF